MFYTHSGFLFIPDFCYNINMKNKKGFTLIELLIVITIIAILAATVFVAIDPLTRLRTARDTTRLEQVTEIKKALDLYALDNGHYPSYSDWISGSITSPTLGTAYLATIPKAPTPADGNCGDNNEYVYWPSNNLSSYTLTFCLGSAVESFTAGVKVLTQAGLANDGCAYSIEGGYMLGGYIEGGSIEGIGENVEGCVQGNYYLEGGGYIEGGN